MPDLAGLGILFKLKESRVFDLACMACLLLKAFSKRGVLMQQKEMTGSGGINKHMNILGWLYIVINILFIILAIVLFFSISFLGQMAEEETVFFLSRALAGGIAVFFSLISIPGIIVGIGLLKRQSWAEIIALVLGVINLFNVPVGTILGVYTLWVIINYRRQNR